MRGLATDELSHLVLVGAGLRRTFEARASCQVVAWAARPSTVQRRAA